MLKRTALLSLFLTFNTLSFTSNASSTLIFNKNIPNTIAANLDWKYREGAVAVHPRNSLMVSNVDSHVYHPLIWKSRYGSVVFHAGNRYKLGLAANGMNEKGLVASMLLLKSSSYPHNLEQPTLSTADWVQYVLDNFQSVQEVIDDSAQYQLLPVAYRGVTLNVHLVINDAQGKSAVLEYINGQLVVYSEDQLTHLAVTNTEYDAALSILNENKELANSNMLPGGYDSGSRFIRAAYYLKRLPSFVAKEEHIAYAFNGLSDVAQAPATPTPTQLSIVFDGSTQTIYFRSINEAALRVIHLNAFDFNKLDELLTLNVYRHYAGDVAEEFKSIYN